MSEQSTTEQQLQGQQASDIASAAARPDSRRQPRAAPPHHHIVYPSLWETFSSLLGIIVIALFVLSFIVQPFRIPSESMERTLLVGDFLLVNKTIYGPPGTGRPCCPISPCSAATSSSSTSRSIPLTTS